MASVGGIFKFSNGIVSGKSVGVHLGGLNGGTRTVKGALNIEVFNGTSGKVSKGFGQRAVDPTVKGYVAPRISGTGIKQELTGRDLTLYGGSYKVVDVNTSTVKGNA